MKKKNKNPVGLRAFNALGVTLLLSSVIYILVAGFHSVAMAAVAFSIAGVATPVGLSNDGPLEILLGTLDAIFDGAVAIVEGIATAISGLFG
ncbi:hypothetical protein [Pseudomonas sp. EA_35y_Pfl2_R5]|uniref:hypothetical protein n=1 Tax=Pseudomonas sp. EA_35y_Pfl2_R5 TaxID=3088690 RepID=UPI0030DD4472